MELEKELLPIEAKPIGSSQATQSYWALFKATFPLGFITFGGPIAHIAVLEREFVSKRGWVTNEQFTELIALGQSLPGPTSTQMVIAMGTLAKGSPLGGMLAFSCFCFPSLVVLIVAAVFLSDQSTVLNFPQWLKYFLDGICAAAISLVAQAAYKLTQKVAKTRLTQTVLILGAIAHFLVPQAIYMIVIMFAGGVLSLFFKENDTTPPADIIKQEPANESELQKKRDIPLLGCWSIFLYLITFLASLGLYLGFPELEQPRYFFAFYKIGSLIFGGGHVVLPMIMTEFTQNVSETQFLNGFAIVSALPGPMFNFSAFIGYVVDGLPGAILCTIAMFLPAFFTIWGFLPLWTNYRNKPFVKRLLRGVCATAVGFIYVALVKLILAGGQNNLTNTIVIALFSFCLLDIWEWPAPIVLALGGAFKIFLSNIL